MFDIVAKLQYLKETKTKIMNVLVSKGKLIDEGTPFRDYVDLIDDISGDPADEGLQDDIKQLDLINGEVYFKPVNHEASIDNINGEVI